MPSKEALSKLKMSQPPPNGQENYQYLISVWEQEYMFTFKDFLRWYNNEDADPTESMQKMVDFYHKKRMAIEKLGCTLPNLANNCLQKSTKEVLSLHTERQGLAGKNMQRHRWWTIHCVYKESCCGRD